MKAKYFLYHICMKFKYSENVIKYAVTSKMFHTWGLTELQTMLYHHHLCSSFKPLLRTKTVSVCLFIIQNFSLLNSSAT